VDRLYDKLISYGNDGYYPMHMPGHKRNTLLCGMDNPYKLDITEIEGFDNLHQPEGVLKELAGRLSGLYGAKESFPLINGSTAGILAGISAAVNRGDKVLLARNSHRSVFHAVILMGLEPVYIYPQQPEQLPINGGISAREIEELLISSPDIKLAVITSPTYEGVVSDIGEIAGAAHRHGALLLVDEAHGAHFGFHAGFPKSAVTLGADIVVQSLHKTLPSFTQTAVLHCNREDLNKRIRRYLAIYQSSSPSYLLMAGMDRCLHILEEQGKELFDAYYERLGEFHLSMKALKGLKIADSGIIGYNGVYDLDPSKITISVRDTGISGHRLQELLRDKYHIELEMAAPDYALGMTSICDTPEGFARLAEALLAIDRGLEASGKEIISTEKNVIKPVQAMLPQKAAEAQLMQIKLLEGEGRISGGFISLFPPGIPLLVPGERIDKSLIDHIQWVRREGFTVTGLAGTDKDEIEVTFNL
jgi:arginine/lysine/ornithine decarboxylase